MATPTYTTVLDQINAYIVANGSNDITANVLNPILQYLLNFSNNNIGDLSTLTTSENNSVVESINSLKDLFENLTNNGVQLHTGINDPNSTPPIAYNYADFYMQLDVDDLPVKLWQWNGFEWADTSKNSDILLNQYSSTPSDWAAQSYPSGQVVFYGGKQWIATANTVSGEIPSISAKWTDVTFEALASDIATADTNNVKLIGDQSIDGVKTFLKKIQVANGTLSAPSISFYDELSGDTGFNHDADGVIDVVINGTLTQKFEVDKTTVSVPLIAENTFQAIRVGGAGKIEIDGDQLFHRKYSLQNAITGISNAGFEIRDETGGFSPMYIMDDGRVTFNFASYAPTAAVGTNTSQIATTAFVLANGARPYKVYTALLSQTGTNAPTATVLENSTGYTFTYSYGSTGQFGVTSSTSLPDGKTGILIGSGNSVGGTTKNVTASFASGTVAVLTSSNTGVATNGILDRTIIEIRIYP